MHIYILISFYRCLNGGTCIDGVDNYTCLCPAQVSGVNCECILDDDEYHCNITTTKITTFHETTATYYAQTVTDDTEFTTISTVITGSSTANVSHPSKTSRTSQPSTEIVNTIPFTTSSSVEATKTDTTQSRKSKDVDSFSSTSEISKTDLIWFGSSEEDISPKFESTTEVRLDGHKSTPSTVRTTAVPTSEIEQTTEEKYEIFYTVPEEYSTINPPNLTGPKLATFDTTNFETSPLSNDIYSTTGFGENISSAFNQTIQWYETTETIPDEAKTTDVIWSEDEWNATKFITDTTQFPYQCLNTTCLNEGKCYITEDGPKVKELLKLLSVQDKTLITQPATQFFPS